jgi:hypothetical protein
MACWKIHHLKFIKNYVPSYKPPFKVKGISHFSYGFPYGFPRIFRGFPSHELEDTGGCPALGPGLGEVSACRSFGVSSNSITLILNNPINGPNYVEIPY